jgi:exonuclease VII large subunit
MNLRAALRSKQIKTAADNSSGYTHEAVRDMVVFNLDRRIYMATQHAAETYNSAAAELEVATKRMDDALNALLESEKATSEKAKAAISRAKDSAAQIGDALARVNRLLGTDFEAKLAQLERTAAALSQLAELDKSGRLAGVIAAMGK